MSHSVRITVEEIVDGKIVESSQVIEKEITQVSSIAELGFRHREQIDILQAVQDGLLRAQSCYLRENIKTCSKCGAKLHNAGHTKSNLHSVFTDHKVSIQRQRCAKCGWTSVPSVRSLFSTEVHPDLAKMHSESACTHTYRQAVDDLNRYSYYPRKVNNHEHLYRTVEQIGGYIAEHADTTIPDDIAPAAELICQVDGGHLKAKDRDKRSFEAITSVLYNPINIEYPEIKRRESTPEDAPIRGMIKSKHCAASALDDNGKVINAQTLVAAKKQGLTKDTKLTALCDGAENCWRVVDHLAAHCSTVTRILDWFHIAMKFKNISLPNYLSKKLVRIKWCLWHYKVEDALNRFNGIIEKTRKKTMKDRLVKLRNYLINNKNYLCHYADRHKNKKLISSSLAESTVETLINQRCKGKQHMKWTRRGAHVLLQLRAACASNDWIEHAHQYILPAITQRIAFSA